MAESVALSAKSRGADQMEAGFFSGFLDWLLAVVHHWELLVVTGAIPFALYLADTLLKWKLRRRWYFVLVATGLFLATFAAWREEHEKSKAKEAYMKIETVPNENSVRAFAAAKPPIEKPQDSNVRESGLS